MRPYITKGLAILILIGAVLGFKALSSMNKKEKPKPTISIPKALVQEAQNKVVAVSIEESGRLAARFRVDLYAEVQGVMEQPSREFKPGTSYKAGDVLMRIKNDDYYANLQAQKSVFQSLITGILPDLKLDYPEAYLRWDAYLKAFDMSKPVAELPAPQSDKEKFFLTGKNVYTTYYTTKNLEIILGKYTLKAPFSGVLTEALVTPGSLVRNGQKLGEFIDPSEYELELAIGKALIPSVKVGQEVQVSNPENPAQSWTGKVARINGKMDPATQTVEVYISLKDEDLREGMYLDAHISGEEVDNAIEIQRNLLVDGNKVYVTKSDSTLALQEVKVLHKSRSHAVVQGLADGTPLLVNVIPGAYAGMRVNLEEKE